MNNTQFLTSSYSQFNCTDTGSFACSSQSLHPNPKRFVPKSTESWVIIFLPSLICLEKNDHLGLLKRTWHWILDTFSPLCLLLFTKAIFLKSRFDLLFLSLKTSFDTPMLARENPTLQQMSLFLLFTPTSFFRFICNHSPPLYLKYIRHLFNQPESCHMQ